MTDTLLAGDVLIDGLRGVLDATAADLADLVDAGSRLGWDLGRPHRAIALYYDGPFPARWAGALSWLGRPVSREGRLAWTLVPGSDDAAEIAVIRTRLGTSVRADDVLAASGPVAHGAEQTRTSFDEADRLLRLCRSRDETREMPYSHAGLAQLLVGMPAGRLEEFAGDHLRPLLDRPDLLETLAAWLDSGGSRRVVSERLHLHRNSVGYRVATIRRLLGYDPLDPAVAPALSAALLAGEIVRSRQILAVSGVPAGVSPT